MTRSSPAAADPAGSATLLDGCRVVEATGVLGAYAGRLLGDLGADVVRVEPPSSDEIRRRGPRVQRDRESVSALAAFVNIDKRSLVLDLGVPDGREVMAALVRRADVLVESWTPGSAPPGFDPAATSRLNPRLVHVSVTPFGHGGTRERAPATDLTILAAGGLLSLGGYPDGRPVAVYGGQAEFAASIFAAVGCLIGLIARETTGAGRWVDVSAQEAIASALEEAIPTYDLTGVVRGRSGDALREAGSGIVRCRDGHVALVAGRIGTQRAWESLVEWLVESGTPGATDLTAPEWQTFAYRRTPEGIARFQEIFGRFAATRDRQDLYQAAQRRNIALAPVNEIPDILADEQLAARGFFELIPDPELGSVTAPGRPYRLSGPSLPPLRPARARGADTEAILAQDLGLPPRRIRDLFARGVVA